MVFIFFWLLVCNDYFVKNDNFLEVIGIEEVVIKLEIKVYDYFCD